MVEQARSRASLPVALVRHSLAAPQAVLFCWLTLGLLLAPGVLQLQVDTSTDSVLDRSDPDWAFYQESQALFGGDEILVVALRGETPWSPIVLREVSRLSEAFERLPAIRRVDSIATVPVVHVNSDGVLELEPALPREPAAERTQEHARQRLQNDRIAPRSLVSEDGRVFALNLVLEQGAGEHHEALVRQVRKEVADLDASVSGVPVFRVETNGRTRSEVERFAPFTALALGLLLFAVFRSIWAVLLGVAPGVAGAWAMLSAMGMSGSPLTITTMILPSVVLALGCAYAMHLLAAGRGVAKGEALERSLTAVALPVSLSGLTTAIGLASMGLVRIEAVRFVGAFGATGVLAVTLAALTLLPAGLQLVRASPDTPLGFHWIRVVLAKRLQRAAVAHKHAALSAWALLVIAFGAGISQLAVETDATQWLPRGNPVRDAYEAIREDLSGISPLNVVIRPEDGTSATSPRVLEAVDRLTHYLEQRADVGKAISVADPLRQIHGGFEGNGRQPLPLEPPLIEQYLLLLESVEPLRDLVTADRAAVNILVRADHNGSSHLRRIASDAERWWEQHGPPGVSVRPTGIMYEYARAEDEIAFGQIRGLAFALAVIAAILLAIFRWPRLALVTLLPNAVPLIVTFGTMGLLGVPLDAGTVLVGSLAVGIAVDDTVHLVSVFVEGREGRLSPREALRLAFDRTLPAVLYTTAILGIAFAILGLSEFTFTRNFGLLTAAIMWLCLVADATLLPPLLLGLPERSPRGAARPG